MAKRRDNMLEAFQASTEADSQAEGGSAMGGGTSTPGRSLGGGSRGMHLPMGAGTFLLLQGVLLVLAFLAGQASGGSGTVQAQGQDEWPSGPILEGQASVGDPSADATADRGSAQVPNLVPNLANPAQGGGVLSTRPDRGARRGGTASQGSSGQRPGEASSVRAGTAADAAFADPANRFTLLVFTANGTDFGREMASVNHANLGAQGFAVITPRERGGKWLLHVGAFGSFAAAEQVRTRVANAPGPEGRQTPYAGAYVVNITR
jgi:hypothetical protein